MARSVNLVTWVLEDTSPQMLIGKAMIEIATKAAKQGQPDVFIQQQQHPANKKMKLAKRNNVISWNPPILNFVIS